LVPYPCSVKQDRHGFKSPPIISEIGGAAIVLILPSPGNKLGAVSFLMVLILFSKKNNPSATGKKRRFQPEKISFSRIENAVNAYRKRKKRHSHHSIFLIEEGPF
jgi:hypothetical protein